MALNQNWQKLGRIFNPAEYDLYFGEYAAVPLVYHLKGSTYRIYFTGRDPDNRGLVGYFEINLSNYKQPLHVSHRPVLEPGLPGRFDDSGAMASDLVQIDDQIHLYYVGWNRGTPVPFRNALGLAVSNDNGESFGKLHEGPILDRSIHDACFVSTCCVRRAHGLYRMWYQSCDEWTEYGGELIHKYHIKYAESADGINWERNNISAISFKDSSEYAICTPRVLRLNNRYQMWYSYRSIGTRYLIGYAESQDGLQWERHDQAVRLKPGRSGWDSEMVCYPYIFVHDNRLYMLYNGNGYGKTGIGMATMKRDEV